MALHEKIQNKEVQVADGVVEHGALDTCLKDWLDARSAHTPSQKGWTTKKDNGYASSYDASDKQLHGPQWKPEWNYDEAHRKQYIANLEAFEKNNTWTNTCSQAPCTLCGHTEIVSGTYKWNGTGVYGYLKGDKRDPPPHDEYSYNSGQGHRFFRGVPRPPNRWKGYSLEETDNGGELPK